MATYFFIALGVALFGVLGALANMALMINGGGLNKGNIFAHVGFGACYAIGGVLSVVFGIIWLVQHLSA